jgi:hypothetical protein
MDTRALTGLAGIVFLGFGIMGLINPLWLMDLVGYSTAAATPLVLGEVRAIYGGIFTVLGLFTLIAAANPGGNRGALLLVGLLWLGICGGRIAGAYLDGDPGLLGWIAAGFELFFGLLLTVIALVARPRDEKGPGEPVFPLAAGPTEL